MISVASFRNENNHALSSSSEKNSIGIFKIKPALLAVDVLPLVSDEAVGNQRRGLVVQELEVVGLEVELGLIAHDDTLLLVGMDEIVPKP